MLFASRSKINSTRFRRSLASASPNVTPPSSAFPCAFSSPCVTGDRLGGCCRPTGRMDLRSKRGRSKHRRCRLHSRNLRSETQGDRTPACLERSWRGPLGSSGAPPTPDGPDSAASRGPHLRQTSTVDQEAYEPFVRLLGPGSAWAWQPRSLRASPEPPSGQCALSTTVRSSGAS